MTWSRPGEQRPEQDGGARPQQHQKAEQEPGEEHLGSSPWPDAQHRSECDWPAFPDCAALLVEPNGKEGGDDQETRQRREQDVIPAEADERPDEEHGQHEDAQAVCEARRGAVPEITPPSGKPALAFEQWQVAPSM